MKTFKQQLMQDVRQVFLNIEEFADIHEINGQLIPALVDVSRFERHDVQELHQEPIAVFIKQGALRLPRPGDPVTIDGYHYRCLTVRIEQGCDCLELESTVNL